MLNYLLTEDLKKAILIYIENSRSDYRVGDILALVTAIQQAKELPNDGTPVETHQSE